MMPYFSRFSREALTELLSAPIFTYVSLYLKALPALIILVLLNCRFTAGNFIFTWNFLSWYLTVCYLIFPFVHIPLIKLRDRFATQHHRNPSLKPVTPKAMSYAAGLPLLPIQDFAGSEAKVLPRLLELLLEFILAPLILASLPLLPYS